jgi:hypothetical protein
MQCLNCDCKKFEIKDACFHPEIEGMEIEVIAPAFVCTECQTSLMDAEQMNVLRKRSMEKYLDLRATTNAAPPAHSVRG